MQTHDLAANSTLVLRVDPCLRGIFEIGYGRSEWSRLCIPPLAVTLKGSADLAESIEVMHEHVAHGHPEEGQLIRAVGRIAVIARISRILCYSMPKPHLAGRPRIEKSCEEFHRSED